MKNEYYLVVFAVARAARTSFVFLACASLAEEGPVRLCIKTSAQLAVHVND
jgi:hypothetical protein